jgi:hypothetical protein
MAQQTTEPMTMPTIAATVSAFLTAHEPPLVQWPSHHEQTMSDAHDDESACFEQQNTSFFRERQKNENERKQRKKLRTTSKHGREVG